MAALLGPAEVRDLAALLDVTPTKKLGQNFVHDGNTVRRIVQAARIRTVSRRPQQPELSVSGCGGFFSGNRVIVFGNGEVPDQHYEQSEERQ